MGTPFDFFSPRSWPSDRSVSAEAQANRALLAQAMRKRGFRPYDKEWWHFTLAPRAVSADLFRFSGAVGRDAANGKPGQQGRAFPGDHRSPLT